MIAPLSAKPPPPSVLAAFNSAAHPEPLTGGQGKSWRAGDIVFKPLDALPEALEWQASVLPQVPSTHIRVAPPIRAGDGRFVVDGWTAWKHVEGKHADRRWPEIIQAGVDFHRALAAVPRPEFIARYDDPGQREIGSPGANIPSTISEPSPTSRASPTTCDQSQPRARSSTVT
jgi:hypothetical protein